MTVRNVGIRWQLKKALSIIGRGLSSGILIEARSVLTS